MAMEEYLLGDLRVMRHQFIEERTNGKAICEEIGLDSRMITHKCWMSCRVDNFMVSNVVKF